ncbi:YqzL family protein [Alkalicoccobacillus gibsonii]
MLDLSWKVFTNTGNLDTYLLIKELERDLEAENGPEDTGTSDLTFDSTSQ